LEKLSTTIAGWKTASTREVRIQIPDSIKKLEAIKKEALEIQKAAKINIEKYKKISNEIAISERGRKIVYGSDPKTIDTNISISRSHEYLEQCQKVESSYVKTVKAVDSSITLSEEKLDVKLNKEQIKKVKKATGQINSLLKGHIRAINKIDDLKNLKSDLSLIHHPPATKDFRASKDLKDANEAFATAFLAAHKSIDLAIEAIKPIKGKPIVHALQSSKKSIRESKKDTAKAREELSKHKGKGKAKKPRIKRKRN